MKHILFIGICLLGSIGQSRAQGYALVPGSTYTYEFKNFVFQSAGSTGPVAEVGLTFSSLSPAESFEFKAFENNLLQTPFFSTTFNSGSGLPIFALGAAWQDFQGIFQIHMLTGSTTLLDFYGTVVTPQGDYYSEKPEVVPEPASYAVFATGLMALGLGRYFRSRGRCAGASRAAGST